MLSDFAVGRTVQCNLKSTGSYYPQSSAEKCTAADGAGEEAHSRPRPLSLDYQLPGAHPARSVGEATTGTCKGILLNMHRAMMHDWPATKAPLVAAAQSFPRDQGIKPI